MALSIHEHDGSESLAELADGWLYAPYRFIKAYPAAAHRQHLEDQWQEGAAAPDQAVLVGGGGLAHIGISAFDTKALGAPAGTLMSLVAPSRDPAAAAALAKAAVAWADGRGVRFLQARADARDLAGVRALEEAGFRFSDAILRSVYTIEDISPPGTIGEEGATVVRPANPEDLVRLREISRRIFRQSRFHRDPDYPPEAAAALHDAWVTSAVLGERGFCVVSEVDGAIAGLFTACMDNAINPYVEAPLARMELSAVLPMRRAPSVWLDMAREIYRECRQRGAEVGEGRPQVYNYAILQRQMTTLPSYLRAEVALHRWR